MTFYSMKPIELIKINKNQCNNGFQNIELLFQRILIQHRNISIKLPMIFTRLFTKLPYLLVLCIIFYFISIYLNHKTELPHQLWHYYVDDQEFQRHNQFNHISALKLQHDGEGHYDPIELTIKTRANQLKHFIIDDLNHTHIDQKFTIRKNQIKHAIIKSNHPLNFEKKQNIRLLQSITVDDPYVLVCGKFFSVLFPLIRNLIVFGIILNKIDTFFPLIMFSQSILMLAFLDNQKHYLFQFYKNIFGSYLDIFNSIRLAIFSITQQQSIDGNDLIAQYGFSKSLFYNVSGQFFVALAFLMITIFIKAGAALLKFEKLRSISSKMRGIWNGLLFCLMPRFLVFSSFSIRQVSFESFTEIFYPIIGIGFLSVYLVYGVQLFLQVRRINQKVQYLDESRNEIGLVTRLDHKHDFQFDCLEYSNLYYPVMNFLRLLLFFIPIGAAFDFTYASFGGVIASQLLYIMFTVSSSGFVKGRDSLVYPLSDFILILIQLAHISIGLAQSVMHSEVSVIAEKIFFSLILSVVVFMICSIAADISSAIKQFSSQADDQKSFADKQLKTTKFKRIFKKKSDSKQQKTTVKTQKKQRQDEIWHNDDTLNHSSENQSAVNFKKTTSNVRPKIRKIRQGKLL